MSLASDNQAPVEFISVSFTASADVVAAPTAGTLNATKKIRVLGGLLAASATVTVKFQSDGTDDLTGAMTLIAGVNPLPVNEHGYFEAAVGKKLNAVQSGAGTVSGVLVIQRVPTSSTPSAY